MFISSLEGELLKISLFGISALKAFISNAFKNRILKSGGIDKNNCLACSKSPPRGDGYRKGLGPYSDET